MSILHLRLAGVEPWRSRQHLLQVLDFELQRQLVPHMKDLVPLPGIYDADFIAANQDTRATNLIKGTRQEQVETVRQHIRDFKADKEVDKVIVLWTANTERFGQVGGACVVELLLAEHAETLVVPLSMSIACAFAVPLGLSCETPV